MCQMNFQFFLLAFIQADILNDQFCQKLVNLKQKPGFIFSDLIFFSVHQMFTCKNTGLSNNSLMSAQKIVLQICCKNISKYFINFRNQICRWWLRTFFCLKFLEYSNKNKIHVRRSLVAWFSHDLLFEKEIQVCKGNPRLLDTIVYLNI